MTSPSQETQGAGALSSEQRVRRLWALVCELLQARRRADLAIEKILVSTPERNRRRAINRIMRVFSALPMEVQSDAVVQRATAHLLAAIVQAPPLAITEPPE